MQASSMRKAQYTVMEKQELVEKNIASGVEGFRGSSLGRHMEFLNIHYWAQYCGFLSIIKIK
jgi:hypothetical protein